MPAIPRSGTIRACSPPRPATTGGPTAAGFRAAAPAIRAVAAARATRAVPAAPRRIRPGAVGHQRIPHAEAARRRTRPGVADHHRIPRAGAARRPTRPAEGEGRPIPPGAAVPRPRCRTGATHRPAGQRHRCGAVPPRRTSHRVGAVRRVPAIHPTSPGPVAGARVGAPRALHSGPHPGTPGGAPSRAWTIPTTAASARRPAGNGGASARMRHPRGTRPSRASSYPCGGCCPSAWPGSPGSSPSA